MTRSIHRSGLQFPHIRWRISVAIYYLHPRSRFLQKDITSQSLPLASPRRRLSVKLKRRYSIYPWSNDIRQRIANVLRKIKLPSSNINKEERLVLRKLKQNNNILILSANKENTTVVLDKEDYCNKINAILADHNVYKKLKRNSISSIEKKTSPLLKSSVFSPQTIKKLMPRESSRIFDSQTLWSAQNS